MSMCFVNNTCVTYSLYDCPICIIIGRYHACLYWTIKDPDNRHYATGLCDCVFICIILQTGKNRL